LVAAADLGLSIVVLTAVLHPGVPWQFDRDLGIHIHSD